MATSSLWPGHPAPKPDETFASWFTRVAHANGLSAAQLLPIALPGTQLFSRDLDRLADPNLIDALARHTGLGKGQIRATTFAPYLGRLLEQDDGISKLPWIAPVGREASKRAFGQQICPLCLDEGTPYLRRIWRLGFVTACSRHKVLLLDLCPQCACAISTTTRHRDQIICPQCQYDLRRSPTEPAHIDGLAFQHRVLEVLQDNWMELGAYGPVHSLAAFTIVRLVMRLLTTLQQAMGLRQFVAHDMGDDQTNFAAIPRVREIEYLNPQCRHHLLRLTGHLLRDWPHGFVRAVDQFVLQPWDMIRGRDVPFAFWHPVSTYLTRPVHYLDEAQIAAAKAHLQAQGRTADYWSMVKLTGTKMRLKPGLYDPANDHAPYGTGRYWKIDGVAPEVKEAVKRAAHQAGEGVGLWLDGLLRKHLNLPIVAKDFTISTNF